MKFNKTGRRYGQMTAMVLSTRGMFTWKAFVPPLTRTQARMRCRELFLEGRLVCLRPSAIGRNKPLALYALP